MILETDLMAAIAAHTPAHYTSVGQPYGVGVPDTFIAPCAVCGDPACYAHADPLTHTPTHSPLSLAFAQAERELGARIGYPALVYQKEDTYTLECANCYHIGPCVDDGEAYICVDRAACQVRAQQTAAPPVDRAGLIADLRRANDAADARQAAHALTLANETIAAYHACVGSLREAERLGEQFDQAHQHVGALNKELETAIEWIQERGTTSEQYAPTAAEIVPQLFAAAHAARAWLRREAK